MAKTISLFLLISLQIIIQISKTECKPEPGQKMALGAGLLAGGLAGAAVTSILTQNSPTEHHYHQNFQNSSNTTLNPVPSQVPATTVERYETFANGCYKQVVKEADLTDIRRFIETEQLICPPGISPSSVTVLSNELQQPIIPRVQMVPLMPMLSGQSSASALPSTNSTHYYAAPPTAPEMEPPNIAQLNDTHIVVMPPPSIPLASLSSVITSQKNEPSVAEHPLNSTFVPAVMYQPVQHNISTRPLIPSYAPEINPPHLEPVDPAPIAALPPPSATSNSMPAVITKQKNEPSVMNSPVLAEAPDSATSHVMIISKKVGYYDHDRKANAANTLNNVNCLVLFVLITIFSYFM